MTFLRKNQWIIISNNRGRAIDAEHPELRRTLGDYQVKQLKRIEAFRKKRGGDHSVTTFYFLKQWESILKMGSLGESKMWKIKRGSISDRRFEHGVNVAAHMRHIFLGSAPPRHWHKQGPKSALYFPMSLGDAHFQRFSMRNTTDIYHRSSKKWSARSYFELGARLPLDRFGVFIFCTQYFKLSEIEKKKKN